MPARVARLAFAGGETRPARAVEVHAENLLRPRAARHEHHVRAGFGIDLGFHFHGARAGDAPEIRAVDIGGVNLRPAARRRGIENLLPVRREIWRGVHRSLLVVEGQPPALRSKDKYTRIT